ncbi:MAG: NAD(P)-binding domain-containing protein [Planctomycetota bacterium]
MVKLVEAARRMFVGRGSFTDFGDRYPDLDSNRMSSIDGLYVVGNIAGTPDIRAALNAGSDVGRLLERGDGLAESGTEADFDVVVIGAGPAGLACAEVLRHAGLRFCVLERKKTLATIRAFESSLLLYNAVTGDRGNRSAFEFGEMPAGELVAKWEAKLAELDLPIREGVNVADVTRKHGVFHVELKGGETLTAKRVVMAVGKLVFLEKLKAGEERLDCRLTENSIAKRDEPETSPECEVVDRIGIRRERELDARGIAFLTAWVVGIVGMYWWLYYGKTNAEGKHLIPFTDLALPGWFLYSTAYTLVIWIFGIRAIRRWKSPLQTKKFALLIASQTTLFWGIPTFVFANIGGFSSPGSGYELGYIWPLAVKPENTEYWFNAGGWAFYMFAWNMILSFVLIPIVAIKHGKKYCSWVCGCGGLAETLGDPWRHYSPKGKDNIARERMGLWVTGFATIATVVVFLNLALPSNRALAGTSSLLTGLYGSIVDVWLIGIIPVALYPFLGGKTWCRYWCPSAVYMQLVSRFWATFKSKGEAVKRSTYAIFSRKERCIACNMCTRYCEVGIDVRKFAIKGQAFDNTNSSCIGCGICISVCPTETLDFDPTFGGKLPAK